MSGEGDGHFMFAFNRVYLFFHVGTVLTSSFGELEGEDDYSTITSVV